jgi:hypothetical protein
MIPAGLLTYSYAKRLPDCSVALSIVSPIFQKQFIFEKEFTAAGLFRTFT